MVVIRGRASIMLVHFDKVAGIPGKLPVHSPIRNRASGILYSDYWNDLIFTVEFSFSKPLQL